MTILLWILGILASLFGLQTARVSHAKKKTREAESQLEYEQARVKRQQKVADTKDAILEKQKQQVE